MLPNKGNTMQSFIKPEEIEFGDEFKVINPDYIHQYGLIGKAEGHIFDNALRLKFPNGEDYKFYFVDIERVNWKGNTIVLADPIKDKDFFDKIESPEFREALRKEIKKSNNR
jgi:hypothetical protein